MILFPPPRRQIGSLPSLVVPNLFLLFCTLPAVADIDAAQFDTDLNAIAGHASRVIGSEGYERTADYLRDQLGRLPHVEFREQLYSVMMPVTRRCELALPGGRAEKMYPFWPAAVRVDSTPEAGVTGRLVYCGEGNFRQIRPADLAGQIAVVEASGRDQWTQAFYFGAKAVLVLGQAAMAHHPGTTYDDLRSHELSIPVRLPRYYVPPGPLAESLRKGELVGPATVRADVRWERRTARNFYALVRPAGQAGHSPGASLMFAAPFESSSLVPDLSPGASQGVQAAAALALLRELSRQPLARPVVVFFGGADSVQFLATRQMFMAFSDVPAMWREQLDGGGSDGLTWREARLGRDLERARAVAGDPRQLDPVKDRPLIDRITKIIETDAATELDELFRLRQSGTGVSPAVAGEAPMPLQRLEFNQIRFNALRYALQRDTSKLADTPDPADPAGPKGLSLLALARLYLDRATTRMAGDPATGAEGLLQQYAERRRELEGRIDLYQWLARALGLPDDPDPRSNNHRLIEMLIALDLTDGNTRCGPMYWGQFQRTSNIAQIQDYREWFNAAGAGVAFDNRAFVDLSPLGGQEAASSYLCASMPIGSEMCTAFGVPGFSMITLDDLRVHRDTPNDLLAGVQRELILPQLRGVRNLFWAAWNDPRFHGPPEVKWQTESVRGQVVSPAPGRPVPDLPREGFLATYYYSPGGKVPRITPLPFTLGVRRFEVKSCDAEGNYLFENLPKSEGNPRPGGIELQRLVVEVYRMGDDPADRGAITACTDLGKEAGDIRTAVDLKQEPTPIRSLVFDCAEYTLDGLYDPRFLQDLGEVTILDARRNAEPQRFNAMLYRQMMAGFAEPGQKLYLAFRYGRIGNRLLLVNVDDPAKYAGVKSAQDAVRDASRGYAVSELNALPPLAIETTRDFWRIDDLRLSRYKEVGIESDLVSDMHGRAGELLAKAEAALGGEGMQNAEGKRQNEMPKESSSAADVVAPINGGWALEARVYQAAQDMANDVVRAAIFLLLLCIPFAFCMERLLIATPNVYKQIAYVGLIFAAMTGLLWSFHPAFKISSSPLIIILSFAILFMSIIVIGVVYGKFDTELKRLRSGRGSAQAASFARASVLMSAILLGIANMRRRKFRTALTSLTIVLITFAVLCFTSSSRYLGRTELPTGVPASHCGLLLRQRGFRPMPNVTADNLQAVVGGRKLVERWWCVNAADPKDVYHVVATGDLHTPAPIAEAGEPRAVLAADRIAPTTFTTLPTTIPATVPATAPTTQIAPVRPPPEPLPPRVFSAAAVVGFSPGESDLSALRDIKGLRNADGTSKIDRLESGETHLIYFSREIADRLQVREGDWVRICGVYVEVAGIFDAADFDQREVSLGGEPLAPLRYTSGALDAGGRSLDDTALESLDLGAADSASELGGGYEHLSATQFVIVPTYVAKMLPNASLRGVGMKLGDADEARRLAGELSDRYALALFAGLKPGDDVKLISSGSGFPKVSGASAVAVPLAIAGLIIFNTMMGSIAERRREIHVYTSLGLAPLHVGALFVAEAMTYGLIGTVFGYVGGQLAGYLLLKAGWLGGVTLNYSGSSAMLTLGLILAIVLLSALVPARLASQLAAPSIDRTWRVPPPVGDRIVATLPFTINQTAADGALAYLAEFLRAHQEGSIGKFSAGVVEFLTLPGNVHATAAGDLARQPDDQQTLGQGIAEVLRAHVEPPAEPVETPPGTTDGPAPSHTHGLEAVIWLTPFDLGVRQQFRLLIHPGQYRDIYEVQVVLRRLSGDTRSWYRMNRTFLTELRKQFLQWRSLSPQRMLDYVEESKKLFGPTQG